MTYETKYKKGDRVFIALENTETESGYRTLHGQVGNTVTLQGFDVNDGTWSIEESHSAWISELCFEQPVSEEDYAAAIASITGSNPNVWPDPTPREICNPDSFGPGMVLTIGHPDNGRMVVKVPDVKGASKNRWRDVLTGKLVDREDFRAGWRPHIVAGS